LAEGFGGGELAAEAGQFGGYGAVAVGDGFGELAVDMVGGGEGLGGGGDEDLWGGGWRWRWGGGAAVDG